MPVVAEAECPAHPLHFFALPLDLWSIDLDCRFRTIVGAAEVGLNVRSAADVRRVPKRPRQDGQIGLLQGKVTFN